MKRVLWIGLLCLMAAPGVHAETLNLAQAVDRALHADPRIAERKHLVEAARAMLQEAQGASGVRYDVNTFLGLAPGVNGGIFDNGGTVSETCGTNCRLRSDAYKFNDGLSLWANLQFKIIKPLYTFGKIESYSEAAQGNVDVKRGDVRLQRDKTRLEVTRAYYGYLAARDTRYLFEDVAKRLDKAQTLTARWLKQGRGKVKQSDLYALRTAASMVRKYLAQAKAVEKISLDGLKVLTGVGLDHDLQVADDHITPVALPSASLAALQAEALTKRPEIGQLEAGMRARRALVAAHKAEEKPDVYVGLVGSLAYSPNRDRLDNPYITDPYNHAGVTPVVGVKWQWNAGMQSARVARAQAEMNALVQKSAYARNGIPFQVAEAYHTAHGDYDAVQDLEHASHDGRRWMIGRYADYEAGLEEPSKVIEAFQGYVLAHSDYLGTVDKYNNDVAKLMSVSGADE